MTVAECVKNAMMWRGVSPDHTDKLLDEARRWMNAKFCAGDDCTVKKRGIRFYTGDDLSAFLVYEAKSEHMSVLWFRPGDIVQPDGEYANGCRGKEWTYGIVEGYKRTSHPSYSDTWDIVLKTGPGKKTVVQSADCKKLKIAEIPPELLSLAAANCPLLNGGCNG